MSTPINGGANLWTNQNGGLFDNTPPTDVETRSGVSVTTVGSTYVFEVDADIVPTIRDEWQYFCTIKPYTYPSSSAVQEINSKLLVTCRDPNNTGSTRYQFRFRSLYVDKDINNLDLSTVESQDTYFINAPTVGNTQEVDLNGFTNLQGDPSPGQEHWIKVYVKDLFYTPSFGSTGLNYPFLRQGLRIEALTGTSTGLYQTLTAEVSVSNVTSFGGSDGSAQLSISGGSGDYSILWSSGETTSLISGKIAGLYTATITDNVTAEVLNVEAYISEPSIDLTAPPFLNVSPANAIKFSVRTTIDGCDVLESFDTLIKNKNLPGYTVEDYCKKYADCDVVSVQFQSSLPTNKLIINNAVTGALIEEKPAVLKVANINTTLNFNGYIIANGVDTTRVYFNQGSIPNDINVGTVIRLSNTYFAGFEDYEVINIIENASLNEFYLVINLTYSSGNTQESATISYNKNNDEFNIYEVEIDWSTYGNGFYELNVNGTNGIDNYDFDSEPIAVHSKYRNYSKLAWRNIDPAFDLNFDTGFKPFARFETDTYRLTPGIEKESYTTSKNELVNLKSSVFRKANVRFFNMPSYTHELLSLICAHDVIELNNVKVQTEEGPDTPEYRDKFTLANTNIIFTQVNFLKRQNLDDIGDVDGGDDLLVINTGESGFLKVIQ